jgi:hypothetical protein
VQGQVGGESWDAMERQGGDVGRAPAGDLVEGGGAYGRCAASLLVLSCSKNFVLVLYEPGAQYA